MKRLRVVLGVGITVATLTSAAVLVLTSGDTADMSPNEWGDFFAGVSAPIALLWLVIGYFQHGEELKLNTEALTLQQKELRAGATITTEVVAQL